MSRKEHLEDFSLDAYATACGLDDLHGHLYDIGFKVINCGSYLRIYRDSRYVATGKIVKVEGSYFPMLFVFNKNGKMDNSICSIMDHHSNAVPHAGKLQFKYTGHRVYNRRIMHTNGRIYGFSRLEGIDDSCIVEWKEIAETCE